MVLAALLLYTSYCLYNDPNLIDDGYIHLKEAISDMFTYVEEKIIAHHVN